MSNGKVLIIYSIVGLIKRYSYIKMSYFPHYSYSKKEIEVELDLCNYATKSGLTNATGVDTSKMIYCCPYCC